MTRSNKNSWLTISFQGNNYSLYSAETHQCAQRTLTIDGAPYCQSNAVYNATLTDVSSPRETRTVIAKLAFGVSQYQGIMREASFYKQELVPLQGTVVPKFYGFYEGEACGGIIGCLLLERYTAMPKSQNVIETCRQTLLGICKLHQLGVYHGSLGTSTRDILSTISGPRIVDFSKAFRHQCVGCTPQLINGRGGVATDMCGCLELSEAEKIYGCTETFEGIEHRKQEHAQAMRAHMQYLDQYNQYRAQAQAYHQALATVHFASGAPPPARC
ncbi:Protein kinase domain-containing protein [Pleurotus pulmonarius]